MFGGAFLLRVLYSCDIPRKVKIGKNVSFGHRALGVVINSGSVIEDGVSIQHHVLLAGGSDGCPIIRKKCAYRCICNYYGKCRNRRECGYRGWNNGFT